MAEKPGPRRSTAMLTSALDGDPRNAREQTYYRKEYDDQIAREKAEGRALQGFYKQRPANDVRGLQTKIRGKPQRPVYEQALDTMSRRR